METTTSAERVPSETAAANSPGVSKAARVVGWIMSILPVLMLLMSGAMKFSQNAEVQKGFEHLGWPLSLAMALGILELSCTIIYFIPQTAVLGAILLTGYLGGAIATHVRIGEGFIPPVLMGVFLWGGLFLRDRRVRALIPFRR
jgi:hypothetical protein